MNRAGIALAVLLSLAGLAPQPPRGLLPQDYYKEVTVSDVAVSPTGGTIAFTVTTVVERENKRHREIWLQRLRDGVPSGPAFRFSDTAYDASSPRWSPDGNTLAFTSPRAADVNSIWLARVAPLPEEPHHLPGVEGNPVWSPDGAWIAFTKEEVPGTARGLEAGAVSAPGLIASDAVSNTLDLTRFDGRVITSMRYKRDGTVALLPDPSASRPRQVFVVPASGGPARRITSLMHDVHDIAWSRDSQSIVFTADPREDDEYATEMTEDIYSIGREGGQPKPLTTNPGADRSPAWSPVGNRLAFLRQQSPSSKPNVFVVNVRADGTFSGEPRNLTADWDLTPGPAFWTADGSALRFTAEVRGSVHLFEVSASGGPVKQVTTGERTVSSVSASADGRVLAFASDNELSPTELFVARADGKGEQQATAFNAGWLTAIRLQRPERMAWKIADGTEIEGWIIRPIGFSPSSKYPLVLKIHGGPHSQYGHTWFGTSHILSNAGMFVLYCNPRGSTGYGHHFTYATRGHWGEMDSEDLLEGIDAAIARYPQIDAARLGVSGGSYGGFMTNWLTATTGRFRAAVTSRSIVNWESWYGASDSQGLTEYELYGPPWEQRELYRRLSPVSYVERVNTPTLIIEGESDYRTPVVEGEQWFMALKKRRVPVELVRYPRSTHGLSRTGEPWLLVDRLERIRSWFVKWLVERKAATTH